MKIKKFLMFSVLILLGIVTTSCGHKAAEKTNNSTISAPQYDWGKSSGETITVLGDAVTVEREYYKKAFARYEEMTGNTVEVYGYTIEEQEEKLSHVADGTADSPDILISQGGTTLDSFDPDDNFYDFSDAVWVDDLTNIAIDQAVYNGKIIGLPHAEASISGIIYNKEIFKSCGLTVPENQEDFLEACEVLKSKGYIPMYLGYANMFLFYQFPMDSIVADTDTLNALNDFSMSYADIPEMEQIVNWYKVMADRGYFGGNYTEDTAAGRAEALKSGKYAMMLGWDVWLYTDLKEEADQFGLMPAFVGTPENGSFEGPNLSLLVVDKNSLHLEAALDLITFMADPYNYNVAFEGLYTAPVFKHQTKSISTPQYVEAERLIDKLYYNANARLRIRGFSLADAAFIQKYMQDPNYSVEQCLRDMDDARKARWLNDHTIIK